MRLRLMLAALVTFAPVPALAQVTATYEFGKRPVKVETAANGDYRVDIGSTTLMRLDGVEYLATSGDGKTNVTKFRDMLALVEAQMKKGVTPPAPPEGLEGESPLALSGEGEGEAAVAPEDEGEKLIEDGDAADAGGADPVAAEDAEAADDSAPGAAPGILGMPVHFKLTAGAEEKIAGFTGTAWTFGVDYEAAGTKAPPANKPDRNAKVFVMSQDPALAPLAPPFRLAVEAITKFMGPALEGSDFVATLQELLDKGVPLRVESDMKLVSVDSAPIDPARFTLPGPVMQAADFMAISPGPGGGAVMPALP